MKTLKNLLLDQLAEMYVGQQEVARVLSRLAKLATHEELKEALKSDAYNAVGHMSKLAEVFTAFHEPTDGMKGHVLSLLLAEADTLLDRHEESPANDAAIVAAAQKLEHYQIATYGFLHEWAIMLHNGEASILFNEILTDLHASDAELTRLATTTDAGAFSGETWRAKVEDEEEAALAPHGKQHWHHHDWSQHAWRPHSIVGKF